MLNGRFDNLFAEVTRFEGTALAQGVMLYRKPWTRQLRFSSAGFPTIR